MSIAEKLATLAQNMPLVYAAGKAECAQKHHVITVAGNGTDKISFHVPFKPDVLLVFVSEAGMYGKYDVNNTAVHSIYLDLAGFGMIGGKLELYYNKATKGLNMTTVSILTRFSQVADGLVTLQNVTDKSFTNSAGAQLPGIFAEGKDYVVVAAKYTDKTDKERITEYVLGLSDTGGSVTLNGAKKTAAFTDDEWNTLIAQKPGWTFSFI